MTPQQFQSLQKKAHGFRSEKAHERLARLQKIQKWINHHQELIIEALKKDFNKPRFETIISEISPVIDDLKLTSSQLRSWMRDRSVSTPSTLLGHQSFIRYEPKGVVFIIAPWNYPFQLSLSPLVAALSAGNSVVIKPSELTPATSELVKKLVSDCFPNDEVCVELGGKEKTEELLAYDFDHVFFTGSTTVGRVIAKACADRLIPVTLELGGKSPTIVAEDADITEAAEKIFWGKYINRGQSCIAPDYILAHSSVAEPLTRALQELSEKNSQSDKAQIINQHHHSRLQKLALTDQNLNEPTLTLLPIESQEHPAMHEEVFGPVLPILTYNHMEDLQKLISKKEKPLALYIFSKNTDFIDWVLREFPSGGAGINSVMIHFANNNLPFGGVGQSGHGKYHGHFGFLEMSHQRAVIRQSFLSITRRLVMPPYTANKYKLLSWLK